MKDVIKIAILVFFIIISCHVISLAWGIENSDRELADSAASYAGGLWPINETDVGDTVKVYYAKPTSEATIYQSTAFCVGETYGDKGNGTQAFYEITAVVQMKGTEMHWWSKDNRGGKTQTVATNNMAYQMSQIAYCAYKAQAVPEKKVSPDNFEDKWKSVLKYTFKWSLEHGKFSDMRVE